MSDAPVSRPGMDEVRGFQRDRLNEALRRPNIFGGEVTILLQMETMAFIDGLSAVWQAQRAELEARGAFTQAGVHGAFTRIVPQYRDGGAAVASVYAELARQHGWLDLDRTLADEDYGRLLAASRQWALEDRDLELQEIVTTFGPPSLWLGATNPRFPKTLTYAGPVEMLHLHFDSTYRWGDPRSPQSDPVLLATRHGHGESFLGTFTFTRHGHTLRTHPPTAPPAPTPAPDQ